MMIGRCPLEGGPYSSGVASYLERLEFYKECSPTSLVRCSENRKERRKEGETEGGRKEGNKRRKEIKKDGEKEKGRRKGRKR